MRKPRKHYRPRHVHLPVMGGLRDEFSLALRMATATASLGCFSKLQFDKIGGCLNCIIGALDLRPLKDPTIQIAIDGAARAMNQCGERGTRTDVWKLTDAEQLAVLAGIQKAEEALSRMGVFELQKSMELNRAEQIERERMAA